MSARRAFGILFFLGLVGCASTQVSIVGPERELRTPASEILLVESSPSLPAHEVVATMKETTNAYRVAGEAVESLKEEAAKIGADALLDVSWGGRRWQLVATPTGSGPASVTGTAVVATAIRWKDKAAAVEVIRLVAGSELMGKSRP